MSSLSVFARLAATPDDLTTAPNGDVWVTATGDGRVVDLTASATVRQTFRDTNAPEGVIVTADRTLIAEQATNRIVALQGDGTTVPFLDLANHTGQPGVDGLGLDAARGRVLVPNSPEGTLLVVPLGGGSPSPIAANLGRPVSATVGPDGFIYVAAESPTGLLRVPADGGPATRVGTVAQLDEVLSLRGLLYTIGAADGTVRAVDPMTGTDRVLVTGAQRLQGLSTLPDGRLLIVDSSTQTVAAAEACP